MLLCTLTLLSGLAVAQEAPAPAPGPAAPTDDAVVDRPLAIPAHAPSPAASLAQPAGPPQPPASPERLKLLRTYRQQRLVVRGETEIRQGPTTAWTTGWGYGGYGGWSGYYGGMGWGSTTMISNPVWTTRTWGVYQGPERLSTPAFLEEAGQLTKANELSTTISKKRKQAKGWYTVAGVGAAGILTGIVGMGQAQNAESYYTFNAVSLGGVGLVVSGLMGGSFPSAKASQLARYPSMSVSAEEAQEYVDTHNDRLRDELGLTTQEVWAFEVGAEDRR